jgi:hypothetical protein
MSVKCAGALVCVFILANSVLGCGNPSPAPSGSAALVASAPQATGSVAQLDTKLPPTMLKRKATPAELYAKDDAACTGGDKAACTRMAERFSGTGNEGGCGVPRGRPFPMVKRISADTRADHEAYLAAVTKGCASGDTEACKYKKAYSADRNDDPRRIRYAGIRRDSTHLGVWLFQSALLPDVAKTLADIRKQCVAGVCTYPRTALFKKTKPPSDGKLAKEIAAMAIDACDKTHDCDDIYMMLDKDGYTPDELQGVRAAFAKTLTQACLEGECTCGEATKYVADSDATAPDLAVLGCENGEAEGCFALARLYETGKSVAKDERQAGILDDVACPTIHAVSSSETELGEYSPHACDHFAEIFLGGPYPGKDRDRGIYYSDFACMNPGYEPDNAPCVRRGMEFATKRVSTQHNGGDARSAAWADSDPLSVDNECNRPSVKEQCAEFKKALAFVK